MNASIKSKTPDHRTAEPGRRPVTFRAMFVEELRAHREHTGLLQHEFAEANDPLQSGCLAS